MRRESTDTTTVDGSGSGLTPTAPAAAARGAASVVGPIAPASRTSTVARRRPASEWLSSGSHAPQGQDRHGGDDDRARQVSHVVVRGG